MNKQTAHLLEQHFDTAFAAPDGIAKLRELILTLAMQGKLVAQDANDPPASELLKEIEAEKQRLVKAGKIKKPKPLPPIKPEEVPYELPLGWEWVRFGEFTFQITDGAHHTPTYIEEGIPFLSVKDMSSGSLDFSDTRFISPAQHKELIKRCYPQKGDLLLTKVGTTGIPVLVDADCEFSIFVSVALIKFPQHSLSGKFLSWLVKAPLVKKQSEDGTEGVGNKNLVLRKIANFILPLPPLQEQHRIVARIDQLMARCDALEKLRKEREEKRLAVHSAAIKQLLDPTLRAFAPSREKNLRAFVPSCETKEPFDFLVQHFGELYTVKENVTELRKAILQLAVMGRLVPPACRQAGKTPTTLPPPEAGAWWVYVIECENGSFYKGFTEDLPRRWRQHLSGTASDWTKKHPPKQVYYWEKCYSKEAAIKREDYLKSGSGREWFKREVVDNEKAWQPAGELLKEIETEKQRLVKAGKIKKPKPLPPIKPEEVPYELPQGWEWVMFEEIVDIGSGITKGRKLEGRKLISIPYLRVANVQRSYLDLTEIKEIEIPVEETEKYLLISGDLLITEGGDWDKVGRTCIWMEEIPLCGHQNHVFRARKVLSKQNESWLEKYLNSPTARDYFAGASKQTTNLASINKTQLRGCPIPLPPLPEQHRIVARINQLMALCDTLDQQIDAATGKQSELLNAVMGAV